MSMFIDKIVGTDFVWNAISSHLPSKRKKNTSRIISINCPMCTMRGESRDTRFRCGIKPDAGTIGIRCFNCSFVTRWDAGTPLNKNIKAFMTAIGIGEQEIKKLSFQANTIRRFVESSPEAMQQAAITIRRDFERVELPRQARSIMELLEEGCDDPDFLTAAEYMTSRGAFNHGYVDYYWTPDPKMKGRIIIPFHHNGKIVGWTGRLIGDRRGIKYFSSTPKGFIFNSAAMMKQDRKFIIINEGPFDALSIDGVATFGEITAPQAAWINSTGKTPILLADRDKTGQRVIETALSYNWAVAFPKLGKGKGKESWWDEDIKDCDEAVKRYGRLYTLHSIISTATRDKMEIGLKKKLLV